ncbi:MAG: sugar ABC transporter permease [Actinomycetota bacterium]
MTVAGPAAENAELASISPPSTPGQRRKKIATGEGRLALYLVAPTIALLGVIVGYPIVKAIIASFQTDGTGKIDPTTGLFAKGGDFAGLDNYKHWLLQRCTGAGGKGVSCPPGNLGAEFWDSLRVTLFFTVVSVSIEAVIGMLMALMMHKAFKGRGLVRAAILIPWAIPTAVTAKLWAVVFDPQGILNKVLGTHFLWTSDKWPARFAIIIADVWKTTPFIALLILAGLQSIPDELYESARVDGASAWQRFVRITLPLVKPALAVALIFRTLDVLRMFDLPWILTGGANGTSTLSILVVRQLTQGANSAAALSTITFLFIFGIAFIMVRLLSANLVGAQTKGVK